MNHSIAHLENSPSQKSSSPKLRVGAQNDHFEREADSIADQVVQRMPLSGAQPHGHSQAPLGIQRKCAACEAEEKVQRKPLGATNLIQAKPAPGGLNANGKISGQIQAARGGGSALGGQTLAQMNQGFGQDFSSVRIHTDQNAANLSQQLNAKAFTIGQDVFFGQGQFRPDTPSGQHLLAHELTHTLQQGGNSGYIQRAVLHGNDNHGDYAFDDEKCTFDYTQKWFFDFQITATEAEKKSLMQMAEQQIPTLWSGKFPLKPQSTKDGSSCACPGGVAVSVNVKGKEGKKSGRGIQVVVKDSLRANVNPTNGKMEVEHNAKTSDFRGTKYKSGLQYTLAHEFGHTIDLTDEYGGWMKLFVPGNAADSASMMNDGNEVRERHYAYFGSMLSLDTPGCFYAPNGKRMPESENPIELTRNFWGKSLLQDGLKRPDADSSLDKSKYYSQRMSNTRIFGLFYPTTGMSLIQSPGVSNTPLVGPTVGLRLGQIAHPFVFNVSTGLVTNPAKPDAGVYLPTTITAGFRMKSLEVGAQYTPMINLMNPSQVTHLFGAGMQLEF